MRQILYLSLIFLIFSCKDGPDVVKSFGETVTETRVLGDFNELEFGFKVDVELTQDSSKPQSIEITYGKNVLPKIKTEIVNGKLTIVDKNTMNWVRQLDNRIKCKLNVKTLGKISIHGAGNLTSSSKIKSPFFDIYTDAVGKIDLVVDIGILTLNTKNPGTSTFHGHADIFSFSVENGHAVYASELTTDDVYAFLFSTRNCEVKARNILGAKIYGKGNLIYYQTPLVSYRVEELGVGKAIKK